MDTFFEVSKDGGLAQMEFCAFIVGIGEFENGQRRASADFWVVIIQQGDKEFGQRGRVGR